jgi:hypothetical protein
MTDVTRFYPPLAVLVPVWSFLPVYDAAEWTSDLGTHFVREYGSLWEMAGHGGGAYAMVGLGLTAALTVLLAMATLGLPKIAVPTTVAALAAVTTVMLLARPGTGDHPPALADTGVAAAALTTCTAAVALWHAATLLTTTARANRTASLTDDLPATFPDASPEPADPARGGAAAGHTRAGLPDVTAPAGPPVAAHRPATPAEPAATSSAPAHRDAAASRATGSSGDRPPAGSPDPGSTLPPP